MSKSYGQFYGSKRLNRQNILLIFHFHIYFFFDFSKNIFQFHNKTAFGDFPPSKKVSMKIFTDERRKTPTHLNSWFLKNAKIGNQFK